MARHHPIPPCGRATRTSRPFLHASAANVSKKALLSGLAISAFATSVAPVLAQPTDEEAPERRSEVPGRTRDADGMATLPEVRTQGKARVGEYADGRMASESRVGFLGERDFMETPFSTVTYTEAFIADHQAKDISEVISRTDPTVSISGIPGESNESYTIRGLEASVSDVTVNGLAGMGGYYRNSPEMFERAEVLKGPSALLNGMLPKGSVGGSVNLVTKRAPEKPLTRLTGTYVSDSQFGGHIDLGRRFGDDRRFGVRFNGTYRDGGMAVRTHDKKAAQAALGLDWRGSRARASADIYHSQDRTEGVTRGLTLAPGVAVPKTPDPKISWNPPWAYHETTDRGIMLRGDVDLTGHLSAYAAAGLNRTDYESLMGIGQIVNTAGDFRTNFSGVSDRATRRSGDVGLKGKARMAGVEHQIVLNATYYKEEYHLNGFRNLLPEAWQTNIYNPVWGSALSRPARIMAITRTDTRLTSFGLADVLSFAENRVQLTLGARRQNVVSDSFNGTTGARMGQRYKEGATTPAAAILIKANDWISVYANYMEGLSQGATAPNTAANAGETFAPYKTKQKEAGIKFDSGEFAQMVSIYEIKRPNSYTDPVTNIFSFGGEQRNRGLEWSFFGSLHGVRPMGGIAYLAPEVTRTAVTSQEGKQAIGIPRWQANLGVEWDPPILQGLTLTANATSLSKQYLDADNVLSVPGHTKYDRGVRYATRISDRSLDLRFGITNLTNKAYWAKPHFSSLALGAPRTVQVSATIGF